MKLIFIALLATSAMAESSEPKIFRTPVDFRRQTIPINNNTLPRESENSEYTRNVADEEFSCVCSYQQVYPDGTRKHHCVGVAVSMGYVAFAAHCVEGLNKEEMEVVCGITELKNWNRGGAVRKVERIEIYSGYSRKKMKGDVCLIKLSQPLEAVKPIKLSSHGFSLTDQKAYELLGWYYSVNSDGRPTITGLQAHALKRTSYIGCSLQYLFSKLVRPGMMCMGSAGCKDHCNLGPGPVIYYDKENEPCLAGFLSWGASPCGRKGFPEVCTDINSCKAWIEQSISSM